MTNATTKTVKIATCNATGSRYIVQQMTIGRTPADDRVHCWGEVMSAKGLSSKHGKSLTFLRSAVTVAEVEKTFSLLKELWNQNLRALREQGRLVSVSRSGRTATIR